MGPFDRQAAAVAAILGAAYLVRMCSRPMQKLHRQDAIRQMGQLAAAALAGSDDPEPILYAIADGLYPFEADRHDGRRR